MNDREQLLETFNQSADIYDRIRPGYPDALIDDVISLSEIPEQGRILEIGCATGKATEPFAFRGYSMNCLEIGRDLAAVATAKFSDCDSVRIIVSSFECPNAETTASRAWGSQVAFRSDSCRADRLPALGPR